MKSTGVPPGFFSRLLRMYREGAGIKSCAELARRLDGAGHPLTGDAIRKYEDGSRHPRGRDALKACHAMDLDPEQTDALLGALLADILLAFFTDLESTEQ